MEYLEKEIADAIKSVIDPSGHLNNYNKTILKIMDNVMDVINKNKLTDKFNGWQASMLTDGLKLYGGALKKEINATPKGKNHIMTVEFVDIQVKSVTKQVKAATKKEKPHVYTDYEDEE